MPERSDGRRLPRSLYQVGRLPPTTSFLRGLGRNLVAIANHQIGPEHGNCLIKKPGGPSGFGRRVVTCRKVGDLRLFQLVRARWDVMADAEKLDPFDVEALEKSLNDSAARVSTIWISFLISS